MSIRFWRGHVRQSVNSLQGGRYVCVAVHKTPALNVYTTKAQYYGQMDRV